jgi:hypothetical protein
MQEILIKKYEEKAQGHLEGENNKCKDVVIFPWYRSDGKTKVNAGLEIENFKKFNLNILSTIILKENSSQTMILNIYEYCGLKQ